MQFTILSLDRLAVLALFTACFSSLAGAAPAAAKAAAIVPIQMGLAKSFGALAGTTLTSTGNTVISGSGAVGNGGTWPGTAIDGFPPGVASGTLSRGATLAQNGQAACLLAYTNARAAVTTKALPSASLAGVTVLPGVYTFPASAVALSANLTINAAGNAKAQFIFKIDTTFTIAAASKVLLINGAQPCNVYFIVGSSVSIGAAAALQGNILAYTAIASSNAVSNKGTWCALNAAVTLINAQLTAQAGTCST